MRRKFLALLLAVLSAASILVASNIAPAGATGDGSYWGDLPGDYDVVESYGFYSHWDWRNSKDYAFTIDFWNYCGHPETGRDWTNCKEMTVTGYIWDWDQTVQVFHALMPDFVAFQQPIQLGVPGQLSANIPWIMDSYNPQNGYPFAFWAPDTAGGQIEWGGDACYPVDHHAGAYPWCGAGFNAVGYVTGNSTDYAYGSYTEYSVNYAQLWNRDFLTPYYGAESRMMWIKLAMWWEGNQPAWAS